MPAASEEAFTVAVTLPGVVPLPGATVSQLPPEVVPATAVKLRAAPLLETLKLCGAGFEPPVWKAKVREGSDVSSVGAALTVKVTGMVCPLLEACAEVKVMMPLYTPAVSPAVFTDTVKVAGVFAPLGATESQLPPEVVLAAAVKAMLAPPEAEILVVWLGGVVPLSSV